MSELWEAARLLPSYITEVVSGPRLPYAIVAGFAFLVALFFSGRIADLLRQLFVLAAVAAAVFAFLTRRYPLFLLCAFLLAVLAVFRLIRWLLITIRQNHINRRIEERALAKAASRRGSFANKQGYSGAARPIVYEPDPEPMNAGEIREVVDGTEEKPGRTEAAAKTETAAKTEPAAAAAGKDPVLMNREQIFSAVEKLKDLKDAGVLTEAEYSEKTAALYEQLG